MSAPTVDDLQSPVSRISRPGRRRKGIRLLVIVVGAAIVGACIWLVFYSSVLAVADVRVVGAEGASADEVLRAAVVPIGTPLIRVDTGAAQAAVLALPWVGSVEVRRGWPNEIVLAVTMRTPIALLAGSGTAVDAAGVTFAAFGDLPPGLPMVKASGVGLETAMSVLAALPVDIAGRVAEVTAATRDDVSLLMRSGAIVRWGSAEQAEFKADVLRALLRHKRSVYDVTAPELPTTFDR